MGYKVFTDCVDFVGTACKPFAGTKKYISTGAVDIDHIIDSDVELVDYEGKPSRANLEVSTGDILFAKMQGTKKTLVVDEALSNNVYSTGFCAIRAKESILTRRCLYHLVTSQAFLTQKDKNCSGATQKAITNSGLSKINVRVPDYSEQDGITDKLDTLTKIINQRRVEIQRLDNLVKARFVEMFGATPDEKKVTMAEICKCITDGTHQPPKFVGAGIPFLFVSNIVTNEIKYDADKFISEETYAELIKRTPIEIGDILLSTVGSYGHPAVVKTGKPFCFQRHIAYLKPNADVVVSEYLHSAILSENVQKQINERVKGIAQKTLNLSEIREIKIPLPTIELQNQFAAFVEQIDKSKFVGLRPIYYEPRFLKTEMI